MSDTNDTSELSIINDLISTLELCITDDFSASLCTFSNAKRKLEYINDIARLAIKKARE